MKKVCIINSPQSKICPMCGGKMVNGKCKKCGYIEIRKF